MIIMGGPQLANRERERERDGSGGLCSRNGFGGSSLGPYTYNGRFGLVDFVETLILG